MQTINKKLIEHYLSSYGEENRLQRSQEYSIEYITTMHFLLKHLPPHCSLLDCCAGGGVYAFPLAQEGYKVTAGDLIKEHVDIINSKNGNGLLNYVYQGDVLDMSYFANESFDAVLCLGALYHLMEYKDRKKCVTECLRVLKKDGIFSFAYINRHGVYITQFNSGISSPQELHEIYKTGVNGVFYTMDFNEANKMMSKFPVEKITDVGVDGILYPIKNRLKNATADEFTAYMEYHLATCEQPSIIGHSMHGLWIGRKI
jgi:SAM-dependent methyltransferase